jgi:hypothetical protein
MKSFCFHEAKKTLKVKLSIDSFLSLASMESMVRRPQKPFSVEVKRGRNGAASAAPAFFSKLVQHVIPVVEKRPATHPPEPAKPQRRILEAIEIEAAPAPAAEEAPIAGASMFAKSVKPRRGRPPKVAEEPVAERPKLVARNDSATIYTFTRREVVAVAEPVITVAPPGSKTKYAVVARGAPIVNSAPAEPSAHGYVNHAERVEEATNLPRGERWKRRLPKVLW